MKICVFYCENLYTRTSQEPFGWEGGVKLNLPEFTRSVSCFPITITISLMSQSNDLWLFTWDRGSRASLAIENFQCFRHSLVSIVNYGAAHHE